jgi:tetratricopeptide (TPR) repeat protein
MRGVVFSCLLFSMFVVPTAASATDTAPVPDVKAERELLERGVADAEKNDTADSMAALKSVVADPAFSQLSDEEQHRARAILGEELIDNDPATALKLLKLATQSPYMQSADWHARLYAAYRLKDDTDSILCLTAIAQRWPETLSQITDYAILKLGNLAAAASDDAAIGLLDPLHRANWRPSDPFWNAERLWVKLALAHLNSGHVFAAAAILNDVHLPALLIEIRSDKRFDAVVAKDPSHFDVANALAAEIERAKTLSANAPDKLEGINNIAGILITANRPAEALQILDEAVARSKEKTSAYSDQDDQMNWTQDSRANALYDLGRHDESVDAFEQAAHLPEHKTSNVSQTMNLAETLEHLGRPKDALDALAAMNMANTSPYGRMTFSKLRACADAQLNDRTAMASEMDYVKTHAKDSSKLLLEALICTDDKDGLATELVSLLQDPKERETALSFVQDYVRSEGESDIDRAYDARLIAVRDRPDVKAAIAAVGHVGSYPVLSPRS